LVFTRASGAHRVLDGGWWPRTRILSEELPGLLAVVESRFGVVIARISLSATAWDATPERIIVGDRVVQVAWFRACDAHTIRLIGGEFWHLDLLEIEPDTTADAAGAALRLVAHAHTIGALHTILARHQLASSPGTITTAVGALMEDGILDHYGVGVKDPEGNGFDIN
jgi:uncharacterized protein DUF5994